VADLEHENVVSTRAHENVGGEFADVVSARFDARKGEREGLPPGYRMRADAHYVDQLSARSGEVPLRLIAIDDIDSPDVDSSIAASALQPLTESIAAHGVIQPLMVRRTGVRYRLIAGRNRLAAARAAAVARVPCLVYTVDETQAEALAGAVEVRAVVAQAVPVAAPAERGAVDSEILAQVAQSIATIQSAAGLASDDGSPSVRKVALDLMRAAAWRASWQVRAAAILDGSHRWRFRSRSIGHALARVRDGFVPEGRLSGVEVVLQIEDWNLTADVDEDAIVAAVSGAIVATAGAMDGVESPRVTLTAESSDTAGVVIAIAQDAAAMDAADAARFFDETRPERLGGRASAIGAATARVVAHRHGGGATVASAGQGCAVRLTIGSRTRP
jgi:hypothetical protein